jgi:cyclopropane-fatty-acyl-phospholipid synthase
MLEGLLAHFPWRIEVEDWSGGNYRLGRGEPHWSGEHLRVSFRSPAAGARVLAFDGMGLLEKFVEGEVDLEGNLYVLSHIGRYARMSTAVVRAFPRLLASSLFQNQARSRLNVRSHYDIPQAALDVYLDRVYLAYSCGIFDKPHKLDRADALRRGDGEHDDWDSLEKSQWRKFQDAVDFVAPAETDTLLDVGCGYGGQLAVGLDRHKFRRYVGWTHSRNQVDRGKDLLSRYDSDRWEMREGDYRSDDTVYDHITSTGMISHVGPRGLVPYVRNIRRRIKQGGRYLHHSLMRPSNRVPLDFSVGPAFNKRYVWPGFHWFTLGQHVRALESNGFRILGTWNLAEHYSKTAMSWYERMMEGSDEIRSFLGEPTFRAWQVYLAGGVSGMLNNGCDVNRLYCVAV